MNRKISQWIEEWRIGTVNKIEIFEDKIVIGLLIDSISLDTLQFGSSTLHSIPFIFCKTKQWNITLLHSISFHSIPFHQSKQTLMDSGSFFFTFVWTLLENKPFMTPYYNELSINHGNNSFWVHFFYYLLKDIWLRS